MKHRIGLRLVPVVLGVILLACGDDNKTVTGTDGGGTLACTQYGTSNISVSGAETATLNKCTAYFVITDEVGAKSIGLSFHSNGLLNSRFNMIIARDTDRPASGSYTFGDAANQFTAVLTDSIGDRIFVSTGGSLNITASSAGSIAGNMSITAEEISDATTPPIITISGSFTAKCTGATGNISC